jgi:PAS domain S-box-containing protein
MQQILCTYASILLVCVLLIVAIVLHKAIKRIDAQNRELYDIKARLDSLTKSEALLREAQSITSVGSYEIDLIKQKSFWTEQAAINFGLPAEADMNDVDWAALIDPSDKIVVDQLWQEAVENRRVFDCKYRIIKQNGAVAYMHGIGRPIVDQTGFPVRFVGTIRDITESTTMMHRLRDQEIKAMQSERMAYFGKIAGAVAHEINNPLAIIQGGIQVLQRLFQNNQISPELFKKFSNQIDRAAQRVHRIVKSIQACSTDSTSENASLSDAKEIFDNIAQLFSSLARIQGIAFKVILPTNPVDIECQPNEISQAMLNLLMNARDAAVGAVNAKIVLEVTALQDKLLVRISNNGTRIPLEQREKIWEPFYSTKGEKKSLGLGLCVSKAIVERHGGTIELEKDRSDTCFVILIPLAHVEFTKQKILAMR